MNEDENTLLELASIGDEDGVRQLLMKGVDVNYSHPMNRWTALHWASRRGHEGIVKLLVDQGADPSLNNDKGETPAAVAANGNIRKLLHADEEQTIQEPVELAITPNYIRHPEFPHRSRPELGPSLLQEGRDRESGGGDSRDRENGGGANVARKTASDDDELVLKVRLCNASEKDFIEIELPVGQLTYNDLLQTMCQELEVCKDLVIKIRKLPDTIIRKDKDVQRLKTMQELELVLSNKLMSESSRNYKPAVQPRSEHITY